MKCLSIHQPWAHAILRLGKRVENRTWATRHRGPLLIHAAQSRASYDAQDARLWRSVLGCELPRWNSLTTGAILGTVEVIDCARSEWVLPERVEVRGIGPCVWAEPDMWCWVLANPRTFAEPIPYRGAQSLFEVPDDLIPEAFRAGVAPTAAVK